MAAPACPQCAAPNPNEQQRTVFMVPPAKMLRLRMTMIIALCISAVLACVIGTYVGTGMNAIQVLRPVPIVGGLVMLVAFVVAYLAARRPVLARIYTCQNCSHRWYTLEEQEHDETPTRAPSTSEEDARP